MIAVMQDMNSQLVVILLFSMMVLMVLAVFLLFGILRIVRHLEQTMEKSKSSHETHNQAPSPVETAAGGAFETFLNENPSRRNLSKGEQFAAYRQWRQECGLNWSKS